VGKIVMSEFVSLDGVVEDPAGSEGTPFGGWVGVVGGSKESDRIKLAEVEGADALLLGRRTYAAFAARWPSRSGVMADRMNAMPKYVVSATVDSPDWQNSTVLTGDVVKAAAALRDEVAGDIVVYGSFRLTRTLLAHDLVDELRLMVYPVVLGAGARLFGETRKTVRLTHTQTVDDGITYLVYEPVRDGHAGEGPA